MPVSPSKHTNAYVEPLNKQQIRAYRRMTGEQKLLLSLDMIRSTWRIAADAIHNANPGTTDADVQERLRQRRASIYRHEAECDLWRRIDREASP